MLNETIGSAQAQVPGSPDERSGIVGGDDSSIFNIELYNLNQVKNSKELLNDY